MSCLHWISNVFQSCTRPNNELARYRSLQRDLRRVNNRPKNKRFDTHLQILEKNPQKIRDAYKKLPLRTRTFLSIQNAFYLD